MSTNPFSNSSPPPVFGAEAAYSPPNTGAWARSDSLEDDEPFTAAHLAAANEAAVPSVSAAAAAPAGRAAIAQPPHTALTFTGQELGANRGSLWVVWCRLQGVSDAAAQVPLPH